MRSTAPFESRMRISPERKQALKQWRVYSRDELKAPGVAKPHRASFNRRAPRDSRAEKYLWRKD
jgi:hypothetical protein